MADADISELGRKIDRLIESLSSGYKDATKDKKNAADFKTAIEEAKKQLKEITQEYKIGEKDLHDLNYSLKREAEIIRRKIKVEEEEIETLKKAGEFDKANQKRAQVEAARQIGTQIEARRAAENTAEALKNFAANLVTSGTQLTKTLLTNIQSGTTPVAQANAVMTAGMDLASSGLDQFSKGSMEAGSSISKMGGSAKVAGVALQAFGLIAGAVSKGIQVAKFAVEFLGKEYEKVSKSFMEMSRSGALFADGMEGMVHAAGNSGLTLEQFNNVIKNSSESLAATGLGVTNAAKRVGEVGSILQRTGINRELLKLGYSFEEQAELTAEVMANMTRLGSSASNQEVATATKDYAQNLKLISAITGEDARKKAQAAREASQQLAFQQKVAGMSKDQQATIYAAMEQMTEAEQKNFRERIAFGTVINKEGALFEATVPGMREKAEKSAQLALQNQLTVERQMEINAAAQEKYGKGILQANQGVALAGMAGGALTGAMAKNQLDAYNLSRKYSKEAVASAKSNVEGQKNAGGLTDEYAKSMEALQKTQVTVQQVAIDNMQYYAEKVSEINQFLAKTLSRMQEGGVKGIANDILDHLKENLIPILLTAFGGMVLKKITSGYLNRDVKVPGGNASGGATTGGGGPGGGGPGGGGPATGRPVPSADMARARELKAANPGMTSREALDMARQESRPLGKLAAAEARIAGTTAPAAATAVGTAVPAATAAPAAAATGTAAKAAGAAGVAKAAGKGLARFIPGVGLVLGAVDAAHRIKEGDFSGAAMAAGAGAASLIPGVGTALGVGLTGALAAKDAGLFGSGSTPAAETTTADATKMSDLQDLLSKIVDQSKVTNATLRDVVKKLDESNNYHKQTAQNTA